MAKDRHQSFDSKREELKKLHSQKRGGEYSSMQHHEYIITNTKGGKYLYLDEGERNALIDNAPDKITALQEIFPPNRTLAEIRTVEHARPIYQQKALKEFMGLAKSHFANLDYNNRKLQALVDEDLAVRNKAWNELTGLLDKHEKERHPEYFPPENTPTQRR